MKKVFILVFLALLGLHLYGGLYDYPMLVLYTKPGLILLLILFFITQTHHLRAGIFQKLILLGLVFSLSGDVFLMFHGHDNVYFMAGLGSFLIAHLFYIWAFSKTYLQNHMIALIKRQGWVMVLIIGYGFLFFGAIKDGLASLTGPVILYTIVITLMLLIAVNRYERVSRASFWLIAIGAALFVASDSILAWNKFNNPVANSHFKVMSTYGLAQLLIVLGAIQQIEDINNVRP